MTGGQAIEPCGPSDTAPLIGADTDVRPAGIRGQHVSPKQWAAVEDVPAGSWL